MQPCDTRSEKGQLALYRGIGVFLGAKLKCQEDIERIAPRPGYGFSGAMNALWGHCVRKTGMCFGHY